MLRPVERLIAIRYLRARSEEGFVSTITYLSFLGILLGVAALIVVSAVMGGARARMVNQILDLNGHITIEGAKGASLNAEDPIIQQVASGANIGSLTPMIEEQVLLTSAGNAAGAVAYGLLPEDLRGSRRFVGDVVYGDLENLSGWQVFLTRQLARQLDVGLGGKVELLSPKGYETPFGWSPRVKKVTVAGVFDANQDKPLLLMPLDKAQLFFRLKGKYSRLEITTLETDGIDDKVEALATSLGDGYRVQSWKDYYRAFVSALDIERIVVLIVLTLIVIVAAFNIVAGQAMLVQEKGKGIAVLRTMGADRRSVMRIFVTTGGIIGIVGTIIGTLIGLLLALNFEAIIAFLQGSFVGTLIPGELGWLARISPVVSWSLVVFAFVFSICLSLVAAYFPARRAADFDPVEALRYE